MDSVTPYLTVLKQTISEYARSPANGYAYLTESADGELFTVVDVYQQRGVREANTGLIVHLTPEYIVVERDMNNKPLVDALVQRGIPRERIILAYAGEQAPEMLA